MKESKIIQHIFSFSKKERDHFVQFVHSPFFNQHQKTIEFLDHIVAQIHKKYPKLDKELVFKKLYPSQKYNEQKLYNLLSNLKKLYNKYLAVSYLDEHPQMTELFTLEMAYQNKYFDLLTNRAKQLNKHLAAKTNQDDNYYYINYRMESLLGYYRGNYIDRGKTTDLQSMMDHLDRYYILEKLKNGCQISAHQIMMNVQYNAPLLDDILEHVKENEEDFKEDVSINLYYTILMSLRTPGDIQYYTPLKKFLLEHLEQFSTQEREDLYNFTTNFCIREINRGDENFYNELFELYQHALEYGVVYSNGILSEWNYKNIATLGAKLGHFDYVEDFLTREKDKLPPKQRENAFSYNLAYLHYTKGEYNEVLTNLLNVQYTDVQYHINSSFLLLRTYYQMKDTEALLSLIDTFRIYVLRNKKITSERKKGWINFLRLVKKLVLLKHQYHTFSRSEIKEKLSKLEQQVGSTENVMNRHWLIAECQN